MSKWSYDDWSALEVTTSDGYILTTFKVPACPDMPYLGSILLQHGNGEDGASEWFVDEDQKPVPLQLADEGYDVWIGNNRGTEYSQGHTTYDAAGATAEQYWDFSWTEMSEDDKANILAIKEQSNEDKIYYLGYSGGSTQMFYALANDDEGFYKENLHRVIQFAPCFVT